MEGWAQELQELPSPTPSGEGGSPAGLPPPEAQPPLPDGAAAASDWAAELAQLEADMSEDDLVEPDAEVVEGPPVVALVEEPQAEAEAGGAQGAVDGGALVAADARAAAPGDALPPMLQAYRESSALADEQLDARAMEVVGHYCSEDTGVRSLTQLAKALHSSRRQVGRLRLETAALAQQYEREAWRHVQDKIEGVGEHVLERLCYIEAATYDGVDMWLVAKSSASPTSGDLGDKGSVGVAAGAGGSRRRGEKLGPSSLHRPAAGPGVTKVLHTEGSACMLLRSAGQVTALMMRQLNHLQCMDRATAETMVWALGQQAPWVAPSFRRRIRVAITDGGSNNQRAERHLLAARGPEWTGLQLLCDIHVVAGIHRKVFDLLEAEVSGLIAFARSLSGAALLGSLRRALLAVIDERLVIEAPHALSLDAASYRDQVLDLYVGKDPTKAAVRSALARVASGDWRQGRFVYMAQGDESRDEALRLIDAHFVGTVLAHQPTTFPRHRWSGFGRSISDAGLLVAVHGLALPAYERFLRDQFGAISAGVVAAASEEAEAIDDEVGAAAPQPAEAGRSGAERTAAGDMSSAWAQANRAQRGDAVAWLRRGPGAALMIMKIVVGPLESYMAEELEVTKGVRESEAWAEACDQVQQGVDPLDVARGLRLPLVVAASGELDQRAMSRLQQAQEAKRNWDTIPASALTLQTRHLVFKLVSRAGCALYELLGQKHASYPHRLWRLLLEPDAEAFLNADCPKMRDSYSDSFWRYYEGNIGGSAARTELMAIALMAKTNTSRLESLHGHLQRLLRANWQSTQRPGLAAVSAEYVLGRARRRQQRVADPVGGASWWARKARGSKSKRVRGKEGRAKRRRGGGGGYRAFLSQQMRGKAGARITGELAQQYRSLPAAAKAALVDEGRRATHRHRLGGEGAAFGWRNRQAQRRVQDVHLQLRAEQLLALPPPQNLAAVTTWTAPAEFALELRDLQQDARLMRGLKRDRSQALCERFATWQATKGRQLASEAVARAPSLAALAASMVGYPWSAQGALLEWVPPVTTILPRVMGYLRNSQGSDWADGLAARWNELHEVLQHREAPKLAEVEAAKKGKKETSCRDAGLCLCGPDGPKIRQAHGRFLLGMKRILEGPELRQKVSAGSIVFHTKGTAAAKAEGSDEAGAAPEGGECSAPDVEYWVHVGLMYWSPLRPSLRSLTFIRAVGEGGQVELRGEHVYMTLWELSKRLASSSAGSWAMSGYSLVEAPRPIYDLDPTRILVDKLPLQYTWEDTTGLKGKRGTGKNTWAEELEALLEEEAEEEGSEGGEEDPPEDVQDEGGFTEAADAKVDDEASVSSDDHGPLMDLAWYSESELVDDDAELGEPEDLLEGEDGHETDLQVAERSSSATPSGGSSSSSRASTGPAPAAVAPAPADAPLAAEPAPALAAPRALRAAAADLTVAVPSGGFIRYYQRHSILVAHCSRPEEHGDRCRLTRTIRGGARPGQGRPMGLLLSWLAHSDLFADHESHVHLVGPEGELVRSFEARVAARGMGQAHEALAPAFAVERPCDPSEADEPDRVA